MNANVQRMGIQLIVHSSLQQRRRYGVGTHGLNHTLNEETQPHLMESRTDSNGNVNLLKNSKDLYTVCKE